MFSRIFSHLCRLHFTFWKRFNNDLSIRNFCRLMKGSCAPNCVRARREGGYGYKAPDPSGKGGATHCLKGVRNAAHTPATSACVPFTQSAQVFLSHSIPAAQTDTNAPVHPDTRTFEGLTKQCGQSRNETCFCAFSAGDSCLLLECFCSIFRLCVWRGHTLTYLLLPLSFQQTHCAAAMKNRFYAFHPHSARKTHSGNWFVFTLLFLYFWDPLFKNSAFILVYIVFITCTNTIYGSTSETDVDFLIF